MFKTIINLFTKSSKASKDYPVGESEIINFDKENAALKGDLSVITIENLMQLMSHAALSGELRLVSPDNSACFIIRKGALIFGHLQSNSPKIGERLVQANYITTENLQECLRLYQEQSSKQRLGKILVDKNFISDSHLEEVIKEQVKDIFFKVLYWKKGAFSFCVNESLPEEDILLDERIDHLLIEGIVAMDNYS